MNVLDQIYAYLRVHPEGASSEELAGRFLRASASPAVCRSVLLSLLRDDVRFSLDPDGRWQLMPERDPLERPPDRAPFTVVEVTLSSSGERVLEVSARRVQDGKVCARFDAAAGPDAAGGETEEGSRNIEVLASGRNLRSARTSSDPYVRSGH